MKVQTSDTTITENYNVQLYKGIAAVHVLAVNPTSKELKQYGFEPPFEPVYLKNYTDDEGKEHKYMNLRLLCVIDDIEDKPVVSLYFRLRPELQLSKEGAKVRVLDKYGNNAWLSKEDFKNKTVPDNIKDNIDSEFFPCRGGEAELIAFMHKYLGVPPYQTYDRDSETYVHNPKAGEIMFENWNKIFEGDVSEIREAFNREPGNLVRVLLGVRTEEDNKQYQSFICEASTYNNSFISFRRSVNRTLTDAQRIIDSYHHDGRHSNEEYVAELVRPYNNKPTEVTPDENTNIEDIFTEDNIDNLPFD